MGALKIIVVTLARTLIDHKIAEHIKYKQI